MSEEEPEYEVESIVEAKVEKEKGSRKQGAPKLLWKFRVRWKNYTADDDTWEPIASFQGSEHILAAFWERVNASDRNVEDLTQFKAGETFRPVGPPRRKLKRKSTGTSNLNAEAHSSAAPAVGPSNTYPRTSEKRSHPSPAVDESTRVSKRVRGQNTPSGSQNEAAKGIPLQPTPASSTKSPATRRSRRSPSSEVIPDSDEESSRLVPLATFLSPSYHNRNLATIPDKTTSKDIVADAITSESPDPLFDEVPGTKIPGHRARQDNPRVKMVDDPNLTGLQGAISAKARVVTQPTPSSSKGASSSSVKNSKPGPGRSSTRLLKQKNTSSLLTAERGMLKSIKGKYKKEEKRAEEEHGGGPGSPIFVEDEDMLSAVALDNMPAPSAEELLELAGLDEKAVEDLLDFEESEPIDDTPQIPKSSTDLDATTSSKKTVDANGPNMGIVFAKHTLFAEDTTSAEISETISSTWTRSTIFGPLTLGSDSPKRPDRANSSRVFLNLDSTLSIPVLFFSASNSDKLDPNMANKGTPGKFFRTQDALTLLGTVRAGGASASVIIDEDATAEEKEHFNRFCTRLHRGDLFVAVAGVQLLVFCSSVNTLLSQRLNVPTPLLNKPETVLVSKVDIENYMGYADATAAADERRWAQYLASSA